MSFYCSFFIEFIKKFSILILKFLVLILSQKNYIIKNSYSDFLIFIPLYDKINRLKILKIWNDICNKLIFKHFPSFSVILLIFEFLKNKIYSKKYLKFSIFRVYSALYASIISCFSFSLQIIKIFLFLPTFILSI